MFEGLRDRLARWSGSAATVVVSYGVGYVVFPAGSSALAVYRLGDVCGVFTPIFARHAGAQAFNAARLLSPYVTAGTAGTIKLLRRLFQSTPEAIEDGWFLVEVPKPLAITFPTRLPITYPGFDRPDGSSTAESLALR